MKHIAYILTMPNVGSWNGKWSAANRLHCVVKSYTVKSLIPAKVLSMGSYYYNFGDGWGASVECQEVSAKEKTAMRKHSRGFCGYDWMIKEIEDFGRIKSLAERDQEWAISEENILSRKD
jgi:hypothetical protein